MQRFSMILNAVLLVALIWVVTANAGTPAGPNTPPDSTNWYSLKAIYDRLDVGTDGSQSAFTEPTDAPGTGTMHTLNEVMDKAPAADNINGAVPGNVRSGKTYWSLRTDASGSSKWGVISGTLPTQTLIDSSMDVKAGYYTTTTLESVDSDLVASNIKNGVDIFGVTGTFQGGSSSSAPVPKTGQTKCYDASNSEVACPATDRAGQDGQYQKGVALPNPRFTDNSNGTVTDNLTGLIWLKNANCANATRDWATALSDVTQLNMNGQMNSNNCGDTSNSGSHQTDWRLPNVRELHSLIHYGFLDPALSNTAGTGGIPFTGVRSSYYWSSTSYSNNTSYGWIVLLFYGSVCNGGKTGNDYVWPVRGGQ